MIGVGYDSLTGKGSGAYDDDKTGLLIPMSLGVNMFFTNMSSISATFDIGYDIHVVNDSDSAASDSSWNFTSLRYNIGLRYSF